MIMKYKKLILIFIMICCYNTNGTEKKKLDTTNYILSTQTIGPKYQFTKDTKLVETAKIIHEIGSNTLKIALSKKYSKNHYGLPEREEIKSVKDLAEKEPSFKTVLDMPFAYYHIWVYTFSSGKSWTDGFTEEEQKKEYREVYDLAKYLLKTYNGTGKTFLLGNWEGDWHLHPNYERNKDPSPVRIKGMTDWYNVRQKAIDDAKKDVKDTDVKVYHYAEVNLVQKGMKGKKCLINSVLPNTNVDYLSYSSYDTTNPFKGNVKKELHKALDYMESKLPPKKGIKGKRVFIGEYGVPTVHAGSPEKQDRYSRDVCVASLEWGCPFVMYWQVYCNEINKNKHRGYWLIDNKNKKQPFFYTLRNYHSEMKKYVADFKKKNGRAPTDAEIRKKAIEVLKKVKNR